ncbi:MULTISPECIES: ClpXP protease specificity-enhancing factor [Aeromonas]|nr:MULTISPECIES: ClpXP protease specificity-enhancing factor [Aeromonas]EKP0307842.1 ClpXP protease specificity-enhancing factor [Aeromonas veronii]QWZ80345.1 ClpXP protease specificity-enhancing factor [Aeromonas sp. FDAARGOS 1414]UDN23307.1 ClpXP protease specificity-enhancing factor [Aeromonas veronii]
MSMEPTMTPSRPYLLRAFFDWLLDNDLTPHLVVNVNIPHVMVPMQFAQDGQIVLNIAPRAVMQFHMDNEAISFSARFGGVSQQVYIPMAAVLAIHARENGVGTLFPPEPGYDIWLEQAEAPVEPEPEPPRPSGRPTLKVIK